MRFRRRPTLAQTQKAEFLEVLSRSIDAADRAEKALAAGKPVDCEEVREVQRLMHEVNTHPYQRTFQAGL